MTDGKKVVLGVDAGGTQMKGAAVTADGNIADRVERATDRTAGTKGVIAVVEDLLELTADSGAEVAAIGIGAAGFVDHTYGTVMFSPNLVYGDAQVAETVKSRTGLPVFVDNDANAAVWGERSYGSCRGIDDIVLITIGTGIGSGIVVDGRLLRGSTGAGAELGHTVVDPDGPLCACGLRGCFEQIASGTAIENLARRAVEKDPESAVLQFAGSPETITAEAVAKAAREYDQVAREVLRTAGVGLGIGMANAVNLFDPQVIVLAGGVVKAGEPFLGPARDQLAKMMQAQRRRPVRLGVTSLGNDAGVLGAAAMAWDSIGDAA